MARVVSSPLELDDAALVIEVGPYVITAATSFGPRVLGLRLREGPEMFVSLGSDVVIDRPDSGLYRLRGGHRLWVSPEIPWTTYAPDDEPCKVIARAGSLSIAGPVDRVGLRKEIRLSFEDGQLVVDHTVTNAGRDVVEVAPWAITQMRLGGTAIMPVKGEPTPESLQPDRSVALWPYTSLVDSRITWRDRAVLVSATPGPRFKIGSGPRPGKLGYLLDGHLFTKEVDSVGSGSYPDRGAVAQVFSDEHFCELESVGEIRRLETGDRVAHREVWSILSCDDIDTALREVAGETPM